MKKFLMEIAVLFCALGMVCSAALLVQGPSEALAGLAIEFALAICVDTLYRAILVCERRATRKARVDAQIRANAELRRARVPAMGVAVAQERRAADLRVA